MAGPTVTVKNLDQFKLELDNFFSRTVPAQHTLLMKKIALDLLKKIVLRTPVGNPDLWKNPDAHPPGYVGGRARANWQVALDVLPSDSETLATVDANGNLAITDGTNKLLNLNKPYGVVWIFNNLPYIVRLENGWSGQAPQGMLRLSIQEVEAATGPQPDLFL